MDLLAQGKEKKGMAAARTPKTWTGRPRILSRIVLTNEGLVSVLGHFCVVGPSISAKAFTVDARW